MMTYFCGGRVWRGISKPNKNKSLLEKCCAAENPAPHPTGRNGLGRRRNPVADWL
jgi:hypothetical protein